MSNPKNEADVVHALTGEIEVSLDESPTTGYRWVLLEAPKEVVSLGDTFVPSAQTPVPGGGGKKIFRFKIATAGTFLLRFQLKRSWETNPAQVRTIRLVVETR